LRTCEAQQRQSILEGCNRHHHLPKSMSGYRQRSLEVGDVLSLSIVGELLEFRVKRTAIVAKPISMVSLWLENLQVSTEVWCLMRLVRCKESLFHPHFHIPAASPGRSKISNEVGNYLEVSTTYCRCHGSYYILKKFGKCWKPRFDWKNNIRFR